MAVIDKKFWKDAASVWRWDAKPESGVKEDSGEKLQEMPEDIGKQSFDTMEDPAKSATNDRTVILTEQKTPTEKPENSIIVLNQEVFDGYLERQTLKGDMECVRMLIQCGLEETFVEKFTEILRQLEALDRADTQFQKYYKADLSEFLETNIPDALNLTLQYIEYKNAGVEEAMLESTRTEVLEAMDPLLIGIHDKIEEIQRFVRIELNAAAKAYKASMEADGYVDAQYKIK